jgi:hypothetical protein
VRTARNRPRQVFEKDPRAEASLDAIEVNHLVKGGILANGPAVAGPGAGPYIRNQCDASPYLSCARRD